MRVGFALSGTAIFSPPCLAFALSSRQLFGSLSYAYHSHPQPSSSSSIHVCICVCVCVFSTERARAACAHCDVSSWPHSQASISAPATTACRPGRHSERLSPAAWTLIFISGWMIGHHCGRVERRGLRSGAPRCRQHPPLYRRDTNTSAARRLPAFAGPPSRETAAARRAR